MNEATEILSELRAIRVAMDRIAAHFAGEQARNELALGPIYWCGHRHRSRAEATACKVEQDARLAG